MKLFSKKDKGDSVAEKNEDFFVLSEVAEAVDKPIHKTVPQHMLTPEEVLSGFKSENPSNVKNTGALESLKKRIVSAAENNESDLPDDNADQGVNNSHFTDVFPKNSKQPQEHKNPEIAQNHSEKEDDVKIYKASKPAEAPKAQEQAVKTDNPVENISEKKPANQLSKPSLLDKCNAYIKDDDGKKADLDSDPPYKLQSVAEILQSNSDKTLKMLSDKYDISFDDLGHIPKSTEIKKEAAKPEPVIIKPEKTEVPKASESDLNDGTQVFEERISFKNVQSNVKSVISDIDIPPVQTSADTPKNIHNTATITFTPINSKIKGAAKLNVSSKTRPIDLTGEIAELPEVESEPKTVQLEKSEFEDYVPSEEFDCNSANKFIRKYSVFKRNYFLTTILSVFLTVILAFSKLPIMSQLILSHTRTAMIVFTSITALIVILNGNMFLSLKKILNRRSTPDVCASLAALTTLGFAVVGILEKSIINDMLLLLAIILSFRSLTAFYKTSYMLSNMKLIRGRNQKTAVKLIDDTAVTFAMSKNSIEGDVLIAAPQKTANISDFIKYSTFGYFLGGMLPVITTVSVILSVILGFTCTFYFDGLVYGLYAASAVQCFTSLPMAFFIDVLPIYRANKKLKSKGGMIASKTAADHIELSNAIVVEAADLFPAGRVTLHQMKVLSDNNLEDTLVRAASLTESLGSSLAPIFKKIAGTGNITVLPDSDTVKYEDRMGISGWVDNRLLFIGNRTLMEAHGIEVPSVEVDRKILRQGYFPVYVATREKACALLVIQYNVDRDIAKELRTLTAAGVTLLVNSCDPNLIEEMICDYFGLYADSVKVMSAAGSHMYKNAVSPTKSASAPAVYRSNPLALACILNCASKIKKSNTLLTVMYILSAVLGAVIFAYSSLGGSESLISETSILLYGAISTAVSYVFYFFARP